MFKWEGGIKKVPFGNFIGKPKDRILCPEGCLTYEIDTARKNAARASLVIHERIEVGI